MAHFRTSLGKLRGSSVVKQPGFTMPRLRPPASPVLTGGPQPISELAPPVTRPLGQTRPPSRAQDNATRRRQPQGLQDPFLTALERRRSRGRGGRPSSSSVSAVRG